MSEFVKRQIASDEEVEAFDQYAEGEAKAEEIKDSIEQIYQDDNGNQVDVKKMLTKPRRGLLFNLFIFIIVIFTLGGSLYGAYNYVYLKYFSGQAEASISLEGKREAAAGEEFYYILNYKNNDKVALNKIEIKADYPANFIFSEAEPRPDRGNNIWNIASLASSRGGTIKIKGRLAGPEGSNNIMLAEMLYTPDNFSSEFKKSAGFETKINDLGLDFSFAAASSALIGEENEIAVKFKAKDINYINQFNLTALHPAEAQIISGDGAATGTPAGLTVLSGGPNSWQISNLGNNENLFRLKFKIKEKKSPAADIKLVFALPGEEDPSGGQPAKNYVFFEKNFSFDVIKSDLNINLIINGSPLDQSVDFGQTLNYSINYKNTGDAPMKDVIIMAVLESDFLERTSLNDKNNGQASGNAISWSKAQIPALAELPGGAEGVIDLSIKLKPQTQVDLSKAYQVKSYVKYSLGDKAPSGDNQSNTIINKINSDLNLSEQVRYFNDDNLAVGSGPLPPKVGQTTSLKVYWTITNNLHELSDLKVAVSLPAGVGFDGKNRSSVGSIDYDPSTGQVVWNIGRLPVSVYQAGAEFNISVSPGSADGNKIMVLLPGSTVSAIDVETGMAINKALKAKTTRLEDDPLAETDGLVR